jgi:hypothetical protein
MEAGVRTSVDNENKNKIMIRIFFLGVVLLSALRSHAQNQEYLKIVWAEEYQWKVLSNQENDATHMLELIPGGESAENWTMLGTMISYKNTRIAQADQLIAIYGEVAKGQSASAVVTELERHAVGERLWVLFKVETPSFPNDPRPESQLYYAVQGEVTLYVNFIALREKQLSDAFTEKWSKIFKASELVYD